MSPVILEKRDIPMKKIWWTYAVCYSHDLFYDERKLIKPSIEWGLSDRQGRRSTMEDAFVHEPYRVGTEKSCAFFGLFDGHGGSLCGSRLLLSIVQLPLKRVRNCFGQSATADEAVKSGLKTPVLDRPPFAELCQ